MTAGRLPILRNPHAIRPWQHVLEPIYGYIQLAEKLWLDASYSGAWNFGQTIDQGISVGRLAALLTQHWGNLPAFEYDDSEQPHETDTLLLNSAKAQRLLGWESKLTFDDTMRWTRDWYHAFYQGKDMRAYTFEQIRRYEQLEVKPLA